ncbi:TRAP transporter substrate-binding protein [Bacillus sp. Marseille-P3661]|uniref:TRAP transporter substrate-binding protein n=1 Tax=Bacillus sp. Marseille-P3661 TaxID=1936234 RepID=UPI000C857C36|nr:TRAP transporter substrate-binding protein [Bacillus sp. Marseille-P3661]
MKKSKFLLGFLLLIVGMLIISACSSSQSSNSGGSSAGSNSNEQPKEEMKPIELKVAHIFPGTHPIETEIFQPWGVEIEEATNGLVKVKTYPGGTLLPADQTYDGVVDGVSDIGMSFFSYTPGRFPIMQMIELPGIDFKNAKVGSNVARDILSEVNPQEVQDTKILMVGTTGPALLMTQKPVQVLDDLKGMEIRTTGASAGSIESLGGIPVSMPMGDSYDALSKGIVKGILGATESIKAYNLGEVTKYVTETPFLYNGLFYVTMNLETWNSIPKDLQDAITKVTEKYSNEEFPNLFDRDNEAGLKIGTEEHGMEKLTLTDEEKAKWIEILKNYQNKYVEQLEGQGLPGKSTLEKINTLAEQYNGTY